MTEKDLRRALIKTTPKGQLKNKYKWSPKAIIDEWKLIEAKKSREPRMIRDYIIRRIVMAMGFIKQEEMI